MTSFTCASGSSYTFSRNNFISGVDGLNMMKVTGLPSGQWLVCPLPSFTRSGRVIEDRELTLLETIARSRAAARVTLAMRNRQTLRVRLWNTRSLRKAKMGLAVILCKLGIGSTVTKVMYLRRQRRRAGGTK